MEAEVSGALVVHEEALDAVAPASRSVDQLIWQAPHEVAKAVTLFGPGVVVLPMLGRVSGIDGKESLEYSSHPQRASGGLMDRLDLELKFGPLDPQRLIMELSSSKEGLEKRLQSLGNDELQEEVLALQDWREKAMGRLKTLEKRAAWAFLGVCGEGVASQAEIKKAFKRRALELHPDKGGDADRFRLLQEMRDLLVEPKTHELEGSKETKKAGEKEAKKEANGEEDEDEDEEEFSDDSWDADEEFRKMFPKRKKKHKRQDDAEAEELKKEDFQRGKFEAQRRKLQRQLRDTWSRASRLAEEIHRSQIVSGGADALRQLRKFVDRFAVTEVQRLKDNDAKKALRILRRFLEQGSEVLCAAGALDPAATVSVVAMQVNCPLLQAVDSPELQRRCSSLLEAIQALPQIGEQVSSIQLEDGLLLELLIPEPNGHDAAADALPGTRRVPLQLPRDATLGDLRQAALRCGGAQFGKVCPRIFCQGRFLAGSDLTPLAKLQLTDSPLQCLPSNALKTQRPVPKGEVARAPPYKPVAAAEPPALAVESEPPETQQKLVPPPVPEVAPAVETSEQKMSEENKENDDQWFNDFFAEPGEKQREERKAAQEQGRNAMQARLKAQKQALEAKKKLEQERKKAAEKKEATLKQPQPQEKRPPAPVDAPPQIQRVAETNPTALVVAKEEPCTTQLARSRDAWDTTWSHPCAGAKRSDGTAIFCGPCDSWVTVSRFDHHDFEIHCEKVGHFGWID